MQLFPLLLALPLPAHATSILCAAPLYGHPLLPDATTLANSLPYAKSDPHHETDSPRIFAEPAFFAPKFQPLPNPWTTAMVQLPRVWRYRPSPHLPTPSLPLKHASPPQLFPKTQARSARPTPPHHTTRPYDPLTQNPPAPGSARIALLFYANAAGHVPVPSITATWRAPRAAAANVLRYCVGGQQGVGGVWIISDPIQTPYLSLYLYAAGSPFEAVLNGYMSTGRGVDPFNPRGLGAEGVAVNASGLGGAVEERAVLGVGGEVGRGVK